MSLIDNLMNQALKQMGMTPEMVQQQINGIGAAFQTANKTINDKLDRIEYRQQLIMEAMNIKDEARPSAVYSAIEGAR